MDLLARILEYGRDHSDDRFGGYVVNAAGSVGYLRGDELAWSPTEALFDIVATGRTEGARGMALYRLTLHVDDPSIRARLLAMARAPEGPPGWPELPVALAQMMGSLPSPANRPLFEELRANPHLIQNPVAVGVGSVGLMTRCGSSRTTPAIRRRRRQGRAVGEGRWIEFETEWTGSAVVATS